MARQSVRRSEQEPPHIPATGSRIFLPILVFSLLIAAAYACIIARLWVGDFLNSYPYISADGFDWITQGVALHQRLAGIDASAWPILRQPVFVAIASIDSILGVHGGFIAFVQVATTFGTSLMLGMYAAKHGHSVLVCMLTILALLLSVLGEFRFWVLGDALASFLMMAGAITLLSALRRNEFMSVQARAQSLLLPCGLALLAGFTQTYGLIPFFVILSIYTACEMLKPMRWRVILINCLALISVGAIWLVLKFVWVRAIPHGMEPNQFALLQLNFDMTAFYLSVWPLAFGPILLAIGFVMIQKWKVGFGLTREQFSLLASCGAFATMTYFYQWEDARFTFIYLPIIWLLVIALCGRCQGAKAKDVPEKVRTQGAAVVFAAIGSLLVGVTVSPASYWNPALSQIRLSPQSTWIASVTRNAPVDRMALQITCEGMSDVCPDAHVSENMGPYEQMMLGEYVRRKSLAGD